MATPCVPAPTLAHSLFAPHLIASPPTHLNVRLSPLARDLLACLSLVSLIHRLSTASEWRCPLCERFFCEIVVHNNLDTSAPPARFFFFFRFVPPALLLPSTRVSLFRTMHANSGHCFPSVDHVVGCALHLARPMVATQKPLCQTLGQHGANFDSVLACPSVKINVQTYATRPPISPVHPQRSSASVAFCNVALTWPTCAVCIKFFWWHPYLDRPAPHSRRPPFCPGSYALVSNARPQPCRTIT